jgi:ABC-type glycerol-3-phosphate transport system substrate-binding protein
MVERKLSRRELLRGSALAVTGLTLAACAPKVVKETVVVKEEVPKEVTKVAKETVVVKEEVTKEVTKIVEVTKAPVTPRKIDYWYVWGEASLYGQAMQQAVNAYSQIHPDVVVAVGPGKSDRGEAFKTAVAGGVPPDLQVSADVPTRALQGIAEPLDERVDVAGLNRADTTDITWEKDSWQGKLYGLGFLIDMGLGLTYNKSLFEQAGLDPSHAPKTWKDMQAAADAINKRDAAGNLTVVGFRPIDGWGRVTQAWYLMFSPKGTKYFDFEKKKFPFDTPAMRMALETILGFYKSAGAEAMAAFSSAYKGWTGDPQSAFTVGVQGMLINGNWACTDLDRLNKDLKWGVDWVPTVDGRKLQMSDGQSHMLPKNGVNKDPETAFDLAKFMGGFKPYNQGDYGGSRALWEGCGALIVQKAWLASLDRSRYTNLSWYLDSIQQADEWREFGSTVPGLGDFESSFVALVEEVAFGKRTLDQGLQDLQKEADKLAAELYR